MTWLARLGLVLRRTKLFRKRRVVGTSEYSELLEYTLLKPELPKRSRWYTEVSKGLIDRKTVEKCWLIFWGLQAFALLWSGGCLGPSRWPGEFCADSSFSRFLLLDISTLHGWAELNSTGLDSSRQDQWNLLWQMLAFIPVTLIAVYLSIRGVARAMLFLFRFPLFERISLLVLNIIWLPVAANNAHALGCRTQQFTPDILKPTCVELKHASWCDDSCGRAQDHLATISMIGTCLLVVIGLPYFEWRSIRRRCVFWSSMRYDLSVHAAETELVTDLSWDYLRYRMYLFASHTRPWAHYTVAYKAVLIINLVVYNIFWDFAAVRGGVFFSLLLPFVLFSWRRRPYRSKYSSAMHHIMFWTLILAGMNFTLVGGKVRSAVLVFSIVIRFLIGLFITCLIVLAGIWILAIVKKEKWPVCPAAISSAMDDPQSAVTIIKRDRKEFAEMYSRTPEFVDLAFVAKRCNELDGLYRELYSKRQPLCLAVEAALEDWVGLHNSVMGVSLVPNRKLQELVPTLRARLDARDRYLGLVPKSNRQLLLRLFAVRMFMEMHQRAKIRLTKVNRAVPPALNIASQQAPPRRVLNAPSPKNFVAGSWITGLPNHSNTTSSKSPMYEASAMRAINTQSVRVRMQDKPWLGTESTRTVTAGSSEDNPV